jgi:DNA-directed RNA polymerase subunit H (RpoH/RPB5)
MATISPVIVYANIRKMMGYRELTAPPANEAQMIKDLNISNAHIIYSSRKATERRRELACIIVILAANAGAAHTISEFKNLCATIKLTNDIPVNIMFVTFDVFSPSIIKEIARIKAQGMGPVPTARLRVETCLYKNFVADCTLFCMAVPHEIMTPAEVTEYVERTFAVIEELPRILDTEPMSIFYGFEPGQLIRIRRLSENAGEAVTYRLCVGG